MASIKLGDLLVRAKVINEVQLKSALAEQQKWGGRLGEILVRMNILSEDMLVKALSKQLAVPAIDLESMGPVPPHVRAKIPSEVARDLVVLPLQLRDEGKTLLVAMAEPQNIKHLDTLRSVSRCRIVPQLAGRQAIARTFARIYDGEQEISEQESSFKVVDSQGHTLIKNMDEIAPPPARKAAPTAPAPVAAPPPPPPRPAAAAQAAPKSAMEQMKAIEDAQRKEVAALKAMVEILIERGIFTREEYLARVKR